MRGVAPGRVDLPKVRRSGVSATVGFVIVIALLLVGGTLAVSGGGGLLRGGGRFFGAEPSPSPTPATAQVNGGEAVGNGDTSDPEEEPTPKPKGTKFDYTCANNAIKDLSRGKWFLIDVQAGLRTADNGDLYDQVYWRLSRTNSKRQKDPTTVSMIWSTPKELQERFDIPRVGGDRAILVTFSGPVQLDTDQTIERGQFEDEGIDQVRNVRMFERNGKVRTVVGISEDSCARMRANGWGRKATGQKAARVVLDLERVYEGS